MGLNLSDFAGCKYILGNLSLHVIKIFYRMWYCKFENIKLLIFCNIRILKYIFFTILLQKFLSRAVRLQFLVSTLLRSSPCLLILFWSSSWVSAWWPFGDVAITLYAYFTTNIKTLLLLFWVRVQCLRSLMSCVIL